MAPAQPQCRSVPVPDDAFVAYIEIPKGSRNKYEYDAELETIVLDRFLSGSTVYPTDYGYLWWLMPAGTSAHVMITASGNLNQWLFVDSQHDLVVVVTGGSNQASVPDFMIREILPSVLRD